jgi:hypothetical protein
MFSIVNNFTQNDTPNTLRVKLFTMCIVLLRNSLKKPKKKWPRFFFSDIYFCPFLKTSKTNFIIGPDFVFLLIDALFTENIILK